MKRKASKDLVIFLILIPVFLYVAFWISSRMENRLPNYSVSNKASMGYSVFYESLKQLSYPVEKILEPVDKIDNNNIEIVAETVNFDINSDEIKDWVKEGGTLVYLSTNEYFQIQYGNLFEEKGDLKINNIGKGRIITCDSNDITNISLKGDTTAAYELLKEINKYEYEKIYFNEMYMFVNSTEKSLWDYIPIELKLILYQLVLVLIAFLYYKGKRFGEALSFHQEVERSENEYLYSAASLFRQAKTWDTMVDIYYDYFIRNLNCHDDKWLDYWEKEQLTGYHKAKRVYEFHKNIKQNHNHKRTIKDKEYKQIINSIEQLNHIINKRRESN